MSNIAASCTILCEYMHVLFLTASLAIIAADENDNDKDKDKDNDILNYFKGLFQIIFNLTF